METHLAEPVDIFATPDEKAAEAAETANTPRTSHLSSNPFNTRRYQAPTNQPRSAVPQFFNDAIVANTPVSLPKTKKKLPVVPIVIAVVIIAIIVGLVFLLSKGPSIIGGGVNFSESKQKFNTYANKLLFDIDSDKDIPDRDNKEEYSVIDKKYKTETLEESYISSLISSYDNYSTALGKLNQDKLDAKLKEYTAENKKLLEFIKAFSIEEPFDYDDLLDAYTKGDTTISIKIGKYLDHFNNENNSYSATYKAYKTVEFENLMKIIEKYDSFGCFNGGIDQACVNKVMTTDFDDADINNLYEEMVNSSESASSFVESAYSDLLLYCWEIRDMLKGDGQ